MKEGVKWGALQQPAQVDRIIGVVSVVLTFCGIMAIDRMIMRHIYLDNAATTPLDSGVKQAMEPYFGDVYGNPNSLHWFGQQARAAVDRSRESIANAIGARFREIIFTGSATEANNLAIRGAVHYARTSFEQCYPEQPMKIIVSAIEHDSVLATARELEKEGVEVVYISVDEQGFADAKKITDALDERTVLVSVMYANNEIGSIQPIKAIADGIKQFRAREHALPHYPLLHTDAVQAFQFLDCTVDELGVDLLTLSAHKIYGPKGIGALYVRTMNTVMHKSGDRVHLIRPRVVGGGQEFGMRSGTEHVAAIAGFSRAVELAVAHRSGETKRLAQLRALLWDGIQQVCPDARINGMEMDTGLRRYDKMQRNGNASAVVTPAEAGVQVKGSRTLNSRLRGDGKSTLPNILNVYFPGKKGGDLLIALDMRGIAVSSGSACAAFSAKPSHVLAALGFDDTRAGGSLRFSFGRPTTAEDIGHAIDVLREVL